MVAKAEEQVSGFDTVKLALAAVVLVSAVVLFYAYADQSQLLRVLGLLAAVGVAAGIAVTTLPGRRLWGFVRESRTETRKMVWPTRAETMQTTLIVLIIVIIVGIFLWLLDMFLGWAVQGLIGRGG
jgi:preprotein translocase subunit SecE